MRKDFGRGTGVFAVPFSSAKRLDVFRPFFDLPQDRRAGNGYGKEAVRLALEFIKTFPCGKAEYCYLSYEPENVGAKRLYSKFGFIENGEMDGEEIVAVLKL